MIKIRKGEERGHFDHGWLNTYHTFSFADYFDREHMGYSDLRVINEDRVQPGQGFGTHSHRDMEILSYVLEGALEHKDSMGNGSVIRPGDVQRMTAGSGVQHSEFNPSADQAVHFLQIWILPERKGLTPGYEQKYFAPDEKRSRLCLIASQDGQEGSVTIHQDARVFACLMENGKQMTYSMPKGRHAWLQVTKGGLWLNGNRLRQGDGASASDEESLLIKADGVAETLLFDLA
ncbi:MAG: pirin family protein [Acidobacteriota bacterium]|jgi:hypothetical protein